MQILCIGDSSALPRSNVAYNTTWPYLLKREFSHFDFACNFSRGLTTNSLQESGMTENGQMGADMLEFYSPDIVILQLGIVDCAPRYLFRYSVLYKLINHLPQWVKFVFWKFWKSTHNRSIKNADVTISRFKTNLINYLERCAQQQVKSVIVIKIVNPSTKMIESNPQIGHAVSLYNKVYDELSLQYPFLHLVDPLYLGDDSYFVDGYHPNELGNKVIFDILLKALKF